MTVDIIYETHALTIDNESGHATGWLPGRLSKTGRRLARELGERRRADAIAAVFVSDLARAVETAAIAFAGSGMPVTHLAAERSRHIDEPYPGGQSYRQVVSGMRAFLRELAAQWDGRRVLLLTAARIGEDEAGMVDRAA